MRVVIVGTGTGVGKTHVACALLRVWSARGEDVIGLKPIETGVDVGSLGGTSSAGASASIAPVAREGDFERLARAAVPTFHVKPSADNPRAPTDRLQTFHVKRPLYVFPDPISPHLAARRAGTRIELAAIRRWVLEHSRPTTLIETAGGLFSPLDRGVTNLDLVHALLPALILLVAPDRLGVLHDVTATIGFARASGQPIKGLVLSAPDPADASTGHNASAIAALGLAHVVASFPPADEAESSRAAAEQVIAWLTGSGAG